MVRTGVHSPTELEVDNDELWRDNLRLRAMNDELVHVLSEIEIAIVVLDAERRIVQLTPKARAILRLSAKDIGAPIANVQGAIRVSDLEATIAAVVTTQLAFEREVHTF